MKINVLGFELKNVGSENEFVAINKFNKEYFNIPFVTPDRNVFEYELKQMLAQETFLLQ